MEQINENLLCELLVEVKNYLCITWEDEAIHSKLLGIIERGIRYLDRTCGTPLDYSIQDKPKELLLDYCRYAQSDALDEFQNNYLSEILTLQIYFSKSHRDKYSDYERGRNNRRYIEKHKEKYNDTESDVEESDEEIPDF